MKGLEIGGEEHPAYPEYTQFDNVDTWGAAIIGDAGCLFDYVQASSYDHVYARNVLEHFSWRATKDIILEWLRVVKPGGVLEIVVPDTLGIINDYLSGKNEWEHTCERLAGTQNYSGNTHLAFFTYHEFEKLLPDNVDATIEHSHLGGGITVKIMK